MKLGVLAVALLTGGFGFAAAQQDSLATLTGTVRSARDGRPLVDAMVALRGAFSVTDSAGRFTMTRLAPGQYGLRLEYAGQRSRDDYEIVLSRGRTLELSILLDVTVVDLAPIVVEAASTAYALSLAGFYERRGRGFGRFLTRADIERRHPPNLSAMLIGTGVVMRCGRTLLCSPVRVRSGRRCPVSVFIDGMKVENYNIDLIPTEDVLGLEVYRQGVDTPVEFSRFSAPCGAVVIWTRT